MLNYDIYKDKKTGERYLETNLSGKSLLTTPQLNKGTAFSYEERLNFGLIGKLPSRIEELADQTMRAYLQFKNYDSPIQKNIYLHNLHNSNEVLFYKLVQDHIEEMIPIIYTPIVGTAVQEFSSQFRHPRGIYIAYPDKEHIKDILRNRTNPEIDLIVMSDGEGVLGIGDQGVGAMDIPIAKLMVYTIAAGVNPLRTLPILLDVGTNNQTLLDDPLYLGWRHNRITGADYEDFIKLVVDAINEQFPNVFLHWEDFGRKTARRNLDRFRDEICTFNDDIQGTGVVTLAALIAAVKATHIPLKDHRIVIFGAGSAGTGIADQITTALMREGLTKEEASRRFWLLDRSGVLNENSTSAHEEQKPYLRTMSELNSWETDGSGFYDLATVVRNVKPTILIGSSTVANAFNEPLVKEMARHTERPIIFPLSNPTEKSEANPADLLKWTNGKALIATGSPFEPVEYEGRTIAIAQCNNALAFPGIGLGVIASKAKRLTDDMLWVACETAIECSPVHHDPLAPLLPSFSNSHHLSRKIAEAVITQAINEGLAQVDSNLSVQELIDQVTWHPHYLPYRRKVTVDR